MNILAAIVIVILGFTAILFGSAAIVMIGKDRNEKKLKKQDYWTKQIETLLNERISDKKAVYEELEALRKECYEDNKKLNERMMTLSINQNILEENLKNFLNK